MVGVSFETWSEIKRKPMNMGNAMVLNAYVAKFEDNKYVHINSASVGDTVYIIVETIGLTGKKIEVNLLDRDGILDGKNFSVVDLLQDDKDTQGLLTAIVDKQGKAIYKVKLQPSSDKKDIENWGNKINKTKDKKIYTCLLVDADKHNPGVNITYTGRNAKDHENDSRKSSKTNYWLDENGKWFELKKKTPVIVIDPGHGDNNSKNSVYDPGAGSGKEYEKDYALIISKAIKNELEKEHFTVYMTREADINVDPKGPLNWRYEFANKKKGDIFISVHLNSGTDNNVFSVYQQGKGNETQSKNLAKEIMEKLRPIVTVPDNNIRQVKGYTRFSTLSVLNNFKGEAGILMEFGGIDSSANQQNIKGNKDKIGKAVKDGVITYLEKKV
ncbi:N-acetylmuramoyl-L-alanine amidase [Chryseobacterium gallinarum]|uniref:N-acetylmuramoyl-L-alanine amidase family protein n=1 Tax=Chryseobacterium gallinarum TaxID=1324352 RepID=UPI002025AEE7|nr:N-acetylmuramoyl-L-alanine amidase [Chryseobacterium gallinarum]MCL8537226.1 N-acetylmuramoyl-L-alanine amidase [Chryseobacterium gallinarum]